MAPEHRGRSAHDEEQTERGVITDSARRARRFNLFAAAFILKSNSVIIIGSIASQGSFDPQKECATENTPFKPFRPDALEIKRKVYPACCKVCSIIALSSAIPYGLGSAAW